jgi:hypothetical protein
MSPLRGLKDFVGMGTINMSLLTELSLLPSICQRTHGENFFHHAIILREEAKKR